MVSKLTNICVSSVAKSANDSAFTVQQIKDLPFQVHYLYGGALPTRYNDIRLDRKVSLTERVFAKVKRALSGSALSVQERRIRKVLYQNQVKVVVAHFGPSGAMMHPICEDLEIPLIVYFLGYDATDKEVIERYKDRYKAMFDYACAIVCQSRHLRDLTIALGATPDRTHFMPLGADVERYEKLQPDYQGNLILAAGGFVKKKAPYLTLLAFSKVLEEVPDARLELIGDGPLKEVTEQIARGLGLMDRVVFTGSVPHSALSKKFERAAVFVQHSVTEKNGKAEGTPVVIIEASAAGLPIVSTKHAGIQDAVVDGTTGYLVDEFDVQGMASSISKLLLDPVGAASMGKEGRKHVAASFSHDGSVKGLTELINLNI